MSVDQMREQISKVYPSPKWKDKVKHMSDNQVIAIYYKFAKSGKLDEKPKKNTYKKEQKKRVSGYIMETYDEEGCFAEQLSFDF